MFHRPMSLLLNDHVQTKCPNKQTKMSKQTNKQTNKKCPNKIISVPVTQVLQQQNLESYHEEELA